MKPFIKHMGIMALTALVVFMVAQTGSQAPPSPEDFLKGNFHNPDQPRKEKVDIEIKEVKFLKEIEDIIFELTNQERVKHKLHKVIQDEGLRWTSRWHSEDMTKRKYIGHVTPEGVTPADRVAEGHRTLVGYPSENIANLVGYDISDKRKIAEKFVTGWMNSPGHRANILNKKATHLGVGIAHGGPIVTATQNFANVYWFLDKPLPKEVKQGQRLELKSTPFGNSKRIAVSFDFFIEKENTTAGAPISLYFQEPIAKPGPGKYILRLRFKDNRGYEVPIPGPRIKITK